MSSFDFSKRDERLTRDVQIVMITLGLILVTAMFVAAYVAHVL